MKGGAKLEGVKQMEVFISWHGQASKRVAERGTQ
jgi:hypothetical protein